MYKLKFVLGIFLGFSTVYVNAQLSQFTAGETIPDFGKIAQVSGMQTLPKNAQFKISFDLAKAAHPGEINRSIESAARFINMHTAYGVDIKDIKLALVAHGSAVKDFTQPAIYQSKLVEADKDAANKNAALIKTLSKFGVEFYICGQSAAYHGISKENLLPDVHMSLSAMTAHALLQQKGYTINPF